MRRKFFWRDHLCSTGDIIDAPPLGRHRLSVGMLCRSVVHCAGKNAPARGDDRATQVAALNKIPQEIVTYATGFDWASPLPGNPSPPVEERDFLCCPGNIERFVAEGATDA